ncbi:MAG: hypothetical protein KOO65_09565 [Desulfobacterales bacterium]|nr:hypothetical protein [Desulfobacterales bacterium]
MNRSDHVQICELLELLEKKLNIFKSFLSATVQMKDAADLQKMERIEPFVAKRENCIKVIKGIDTRINRIKNSMSALPEEVMEKIRPITKAIDDTVAEATQLNKGFETMLILHQDNTKKQLSKISQNRNGVKGYAAMSRGGKQSIFLNVTS